MVNLANDAIGYIIPKSEWDVEAPGFTKRMKDLWRGSALGPNTALIIHKNLVKL